MPYAALHPDCDALTDPGADDLARLAAHPGQPGLIVFSLRDENLAGLAVLASHLRVLKIAGAPRLRSLDGVERLTELRELVLATPTGSAGSGRSIDVGSFAPLERLARLERLVLHDVRPADLDLTPVTRMSWLRELEITGVAEFTIEHYARLAMALPATQGRCLQPYVTIAGIGACRRCRGQSVLLNGTAPRARRWVCPTCNPALLSRHVARWEALTGRPHRPG
jgi:hypothetical protein